MLLTNRIYHIYNHANGSENLFRSDENFRYFLEKISYYIAPIAEIYCYCLMPNHFHFLLKIKSISEIFSCPVFDKCISNSKIQLNEIQLLDIEQQHLYVSKFISQQFSNMFNSYSKSFNKMYKRRGSLFVPRFKHKIIDDSNYFTSAIIYIHFNPVHHGFVSNIKDWEWSSYNSYTSNTETYVNKNVVLKWFGNMDNFINAHSNKYDVWLEKDLE